ncbi:MAG TPA: hypothetical protein VNS46_02845 [Nocardioides sp.]|nr:hypothetical protein [Nocardioides sp.]
MAVTAAALLALAWGTTGTLSGWTAATVVNSSDTAAAGTVSVTHAYTGGPCVGGPRTATVSCPGSLAPTTGAPASATDAITNDSGRVVTQALTAASCAPVRFANNQQAADPLLARNAVSFQQTDPWGTTSAASFSGSGYATDIVGTTGSGLLGLLSNNYSLGVWFNASDAQGGGLLSLSSSLSNSSGAANPAIWLDTSGKVRYAVTSTLGTSQGVSSASYGSGWHLAVLTVSKSVIGVTMTITLHVDGTVQASSTVLALLTGTSGYWHLGWADFTGLTAPSSSSFHGRLAGAFVNQTTALSAATVASLHTSASATAYRTSLAGMSGTAATWMLGDDGLTTYTGALPGAMAGPCGQVQATLTFTNPAATVGPMTLTSLVAPAANPRTIAAPLAGETQGLTTSTSRGAGYSTDITGLRLLVPLTFTYGTSPATSWTMAMQWTTDPAMVFLA